MMLVSILLMYALKIVQNQIVLVLLKMSLAEHSRGSGYEQKLSLIIDVIPI